MVSCGAGVLLSKYSYFHPLGQKSMGKFVN